MYNFSNVDELDIALLDGIENGFFDPISIRKHASSKDEAIKKGNLHQSFVQSWNLYHDSFDENQDEVLDGIYEAFKRGVSIVPPISLNGTVSLFKALGRHKQAAEMITYYVSSHSEEWSLFDLAKYPFAGHLNDTDVIKAFNEHCETRKPIQTNPAATLLNMAEINGWSPEDIAVLKALPIDDYRKMFKTHRGDQLRRIINACLQFDRIGNASEEMREVSRRAKEALKCIGQESAINAQRVKGYGINVEPTPKSEDA